LGENSGSESVRFEIFINLHISNPLRNQKLAGNYFKATERHIEL
jgi:hypothetical protein